MAGIVALLITLGAGACSTGTASPDQAAPVADVSRSTAPVSSEKDLENLLLDSLTVDGAASYFVDDAWSSVRSPFSVYETYWQLRWRNGVLPAGMDRARFAPWVAIGSIGALDSASLQQVGQIVFATGIAKQLGLKLDASRVSAKLETLRDGGLYSPDPQVKGSWGSTSAAVRAMRHLSISVPEATAQHARAELIRLPVVLDPQTVVNTALPLLEVFVASRKPDDSTVAALRVASAAVESLNGVARGSVDISWLGARYQLETVRAALDQTLLRLDPSQCAALLTASGFVTMPGVASGDTQGTFYARELGCGGTTSEINRPYTRAGWLRGSAVDPFETLGATSAALRLADLINSDIDFASKVRPTVTRLWRPLADDKSLAADARAVVAARLLHLVAAAKLNSLEQEPEISTAANAASAGTLLSLLAAGTAGEESRVRAAKAVFIEPTRRALDGRVSIDMAAELSLAGTYLNDQDALSRARAIAARLRIADTVYAGVECEPNDPKCQSLQPSIAASAIGSWISRTTEAPRHRWETLAMCRGYICSDQSEDGMSLRQLYIAFACGQPGCGREFPLVL